MELSNIFVFGHPSLVVMFLHLRAKRVPVVRYAEREILMIYQIVRVRDPSLAKAKRKMRNRDQSNSTPDLCL